MTKIEIARQQIDSIDAQLAELFKARMQAVLQVLEYKIENHLPILDEIREAKMIQHNLNRFNDADFEVYYLQFLKSVLEISRKYQEDHYE